MRAQLKGRKAKQQWGLPGNGRHLRHDAFQMLLVLKKQEVLWQKAGISASGKVSLVQKSYLVIDGVLTNPPQLV